MQTVWWERPIDPLRKERHAAVKAAEQETHNNLFRQKETPTSPIGEAGVFYL